MATEDTLDQTSGEDKHTPVRCLNSEAWPTGIGREAQPALYKVWLRLEQAIWTVVSVWGRAWRESIFTVIPAITAAVSAGCRSAMSFCTHRCTHKAKPQLGLSTCVFWTDRKPCYANIKQEVNIINYGSISFSFQCKYCPVVAVWSCMCLPLFLTTFFFFF